MEKYQRTLIQNIKKYRGICNLSQAQFAELCDVSTGTIGNIECGVAKPSFDLLVTMASVLGIAPATLLDENEENPCDAQSITEHSLILKMYTLLKNHLQANQ